MLPGIAAGQLSKSHDRSFYIQHLTFCPLFSDVFVHDAFLVSEELVYVQWKYEDCIEQLKAIETWKEHQDLELSKAEETRNDLDNKLAQATEARAALQKELETERGYAKSCISDLNEKVVEMNSKLFNCSEELQSARNDALRFEQEKSTLSVISMAPRNSCQAIAREYMRAYSDD